MKNRILSVVALFALCFTLCLSFVACGDGADAGDGTGGTACTHADANDDLSCDKCGNEYDDGASNPLYTKEERTVLFGSYPQSLVEDDGVIQSLNSKCGALPSSSDAKAWTSYGYYKSGNVSHYMWYIDLSDGAERYRGVYFTSLRPSWATTNPAGAGDYQDNNGYYTSTVYWFKYEPISWTVIAEADGEALLLCDMIIDAQAYQNEYKNREGDVYLKNSTEIYANNYAHSFIRSWLNDTFYNTAFNSYQKQIMLVNTVDNSIESTGMNSNYYVCENTSDKVFLLSAKEAQSSSYGLGSSSNRQKKTTDYAQCQGADSSIGGLDSRYSGNGCWWLRSPSDSDGLYAMCMRNDGYLDDEYIDTVCNGVVPAIKIKL